ncbi:MAG: threonylcarbamoyl-AMP synthase [Rikenellaceae bacterium]|jgi:L-threonylcarbamoyladenylate synthase|nr:threonylcarbamoyl-AMP synthase [Rikenellaceae bacterium]
MEQYITEALATLRSGGLILYPTDTVWGLGCDATNAEAVERIYKLKGSGDKKSMLALVDAPENVARYVKSLPEVAQQLLELSDKPLTLILSGACGIAPNLIPDDGSIGVRVPDHAFCRGLLRRLGRPLVSTSANISGQVAPTRFADITSEIVAGVDYIVPLCCEGAPTRRPSSIIALGEGGQIKIIRE